jgi:hypothetical protein
LLSFLTGSFFFLDGAALRIDRAQMQILGGLDRAGLRRAPKA